MVILVDTTISAFILNIMNSLLIKRKVETCSESNEQDSNLCVKESNEDGKKPKIDENGTGSNAHL